MMTSHAHTRRKHAEREREGEGEEEAKLEDPSLSSLMVPVVGPVW